jgi:Uma2 family endonuclease
VKPRADDATIVGMQGQNEDGMDAAYTSAMKLTYADLCQMPDDGLRHELIDGVHYVSPSASLRHQRIVGELFFGIRQYLGATPVGEVFISPLDVVLSDYDVLEPDVLFLTTEQVAAQTGIHIHGAPALAIEVLSPSSRKMDRDLKRGVYDRCGVQEYWIVDPDREAIHVHRRDAGEALRHVADFTRAAADTLTTPLLPGFACALDALFR